MDSRPRIVRRQFTAFPRVLHIEFFPDVVDLLTNRYVHQTFFGNLFDGVHSGGVIFASELLGNFWKAHLELTAQEVHRDLSRQHDVFVAAR